MHHFYLRRTGLGILYLCFFWTRIPWILGFIECFFMPGRVREFNAIQAAGIAARWAFRCPGWGQPVNVTVNMPPAPTSMRQSASTSTSRHARRLQSLQQTNPAGARFCSGCG